MLSHPRVSLFLSHCGTNSVFEAVTIGVPLVCVPVLPSQVTTGQQLVRVGVLNEVVESLSPSLDVDIASAVRYVRASGVVCTWPCLYVTHVCMHLLRVSCRVSRATCRWVLANSDGVQAAMRRLRLHMRAAGGAERAAQEIELLIASNGTRYRVPVGVDAPYIVRSGLDVHATLAVVVAAAAWGIRRCWRCCCSCCSRRRQPHAKHD